MLFLQRGDLSKVDLIALVGSIPIRIQVKNHQCYNKTGGSIDCVLSKSGPNYRFTYTERDLDVFAYYIPEIERVIYLSWKDFSKKKCIVIRYEKNERITKTTNWYEDYLDFDRCLDA